jgi:hypothetical protein
MSQMTKQDREDILKEDFAFLDSVKVQNINGKLMMSDGEVPFSVATVLYEKEFVRDWLMPFAIGNDLGKNYFKVNEWFQISANGTRAVMIVDDDHKPVLIIAPMINHNLTPREYQMMEQASRMMHSHSADTMKKNDPNANLGLAKALTKALDGKKRVTLTEMVAPEFYLKHGVIPEVEKQIYYIKDNLNNNSRDIKEINAIRPTLYANHRKEPVTQQQVAEVNRLMTGNTEFAFNEESIKGIKGGYERVTVSGVNSKGKETPSDPLEC